MEKEQVVERLKKVICECKDQITVESIHEDSNLINDFMFDSVNVIDMICIIENAFDIEIGDEYLEVEKLASFSELTKIVMTLIE